MRALWEQLAPVSARTVLDLHNIESVLHARCAAKSNAVPKLWRTAYFGARRASSKSDGCLAYDCLLTASPKRMPNLPAAISPRSEITVYPNAIPFVPQPQGARTGR